MTTMIERVAQAIYEDRNGRGCIPWNRLPAAHKAPYLSDARAAIEAMREPTETMVAAALRLDPDGYVKGNWYFMIDAALKEE